MIKAVSYYVFSLIEATIHTDLSLGECVLTILAYTCILFSLKHLYTRGLVNMAKMLSSTAFQYFAIVSRSTPTNNGNWHLLTSAKHAIS